MNKGISIIILLMAFKVSNAQNLVPNGNFEQYSGCPNSAMQIDSALFWSNPSVNFPGGSPDYFNQCTLSSMVGVPTNSFGYQQGHSGVAYAGMIIWQLGVGMYREYIETSVTSPLIANEYYHFEMYISLANNYSNYNTNDIGIYFSDTLISGITNALPLPYLPQINNTVGNFPDTTNWTLVSGNYTAHGGENYLIIGNFKDNSSTTTIGSGIAGAIYFYIDDVFLSLSTAIDEQNETVNFKIYPNPVKDELNITTKGNELLEVSLYDVTSRKILNQSFTTSTTINTSQLAKGIYIYEVRNKNGVIKQDKVVKD